MASHQTLDPLPAAFQTGSQYLSPDPADAIGSFADHEARSYLLFQHAAMDRPVARRVAQPRVVPAMRDNERRAHPPYRPDPLELRLEAEFHVDPSEKEVAAFSECCAPTSDS